MIPLSTGRSPRVDQFYATLRTYKSYKFSQDNHRDQSEEDRSIDHIRSLGKQILEENPVLKKNITMKDNSKSLNKSSQIIFSSSNLYDKYKQQANKKIIKQVNRTKQIIIKQQINRTPEKNKPNKKYSNVASKLQTKATPKGLNYIKKVDIQIQKMKKQKIQMQKNQKIIKQNQGYFQKHAKTSRNYDKQQIVNGIMRRGQQLKIRKQKCIQRIRTQQLQKQKQQLTFTPQIFSKKITTVEPNFQKRNSIADIQRQSNEKLIIKSALQPYSFAPQTNIYKNTKVDSKISKIWHKETKKQSMNKNSTFNMSLQQTKFGQYSYLKSQKTANTTMPINLKSMNEISFIWQ